TLADVEREPNGTSLALDADGLDRDERVPLLAILASIPRLHPVDALALVESPQDLRVYVPIDPEVRDQRVRPDGVLPRKPARFDEHVIDIDESIVLEGADHHEAGRAL